MGHNTMEEKTVVTTTYDNMGRTVEQTTVRIIKQFGSENQAKKEEKETE